jgi:hypothetical protein
MRRQVIRAGLYLIPFTAFFLTCGSPEITGPDALEVVFLPLAGAGGVTLDAEPGLYFSDDVDADSVTGKSVYLESGILVYNTVKAKWVCLEPWESVSGQPEVNPENPRMVVFSPAALLEAETCYRLICTTEVGGTTQGPLRSARIPELPGVAAMQVFSTGSE